MVDTLKAEDTFHTLLPKTGDGAGDGSCRRFPGEVRLLPSSVHDHALTLTIVIISQSYRQVWVHYHACHRLPTSSALGCRPKYEYSECIRAFSPTNRPCSLKTTLSTGLLSATQTKKPRPIPHTIICFCRTTNATTDPRTAIVSPNE